MDNIEEGYCQCGCGRATIRRGRRINKFIQGHHQLSGEKNHKWRGGRTVDGNYMRVRINKKPIREHVVIAESVLGKKIPKGASVHHINGDGHDNRKDNLIICQSEAYHHLLHRREKALRECGHAGWRKCCYCHQYDDPSKLHIRNGPGHAYHGKCDTAYRRELRNRNIDRAERSLLQPAKPRSAVVMQIEDRWSERR